MYINWFGPAQWVTAVVRHDSTANAYHTTVPCLSGRSCSSCNSISCAIDRCVNHFSTHKIVGITTLSRTEHCPAD